MTGDTYFTFDIGLEVDGTSGQQEYVLTLLNKDGAIKISNGKPVENRVPVLYDQTDVEVGEAPGELDTLANCIAVVSGFSSFRTMDWQKKVGLALFNIFFPPKEMNNALSREFRNVLSLKKYKRVRLRLWYPSDENKATMLLKIPWEYFFYSPNSNIEKGFFLCRTSIFSIVHYCRSEKPIKWQNKNPLPVKTVFLSTDETPDVTFRRIEDTSALTHRRKRIIQIDKWARETELNDLRSTFQNYGIVQCVFHGGPGEIFLRKLDGTEALTDNELTEMLSDIQNGRVQTVILCACDNAGVSSAPANQLHKLGVPVVIGFTKIILRTQAVRFVEDLTACLADTACSLEEAMVFARNGLISQSETSIKPKLSLDWGAPRVFLAAANSDLVTIDSLFIPVNENLVTRIKAEVLKLLNKLVGRREFPYENRILEWIKGSQRILYLSGTSGSGKSTQIAHLIETYEPSDQIIYHLCAVKGDPTSDEDLNHPLVFVRDSLYPQLEKCFEKELYRSWVEPNYPQLIDKAEDAIEKLVIEPLRKARNGGQWKQIILVIDGLDHAQVFEPGYTLLDLLTDYIQPLTEVIRLLITAASDHGEAHDRIRDLLKLGDENLEQSDSQKEVIELQADKQKILDELNQHVNKVLGERDDALTTLVETNVQINYQFVEFIKRITDPALLEEIILKPPEDRFLHRAYTLTWESIKTRNPNQISALEKLLTVLGEAYAPLSEGMLADAIEYDQIAVLLREIDPFITRDDQNWVSCEHPSIKYFMQALSSSYDGHNLLLEVYRRQSQDHEWNSLDWTNLKYSNYAAHYLSEHSYWYYIEGKSEDPRQGMDQYLCLMTSPGFRNFRRVSIGKTNVIAAQEDIRRALRVFYVKSSLGDARKSLSIEDALNAASRAMSKVSQIQATYGRSDNTLFLDLERKLSQERSGDPLQPLYDFWSIYYPGLFRKITRDFSRAEIPDKSQDTSYKKSLP